MKLSEALLKEVQALRAEHAEARMEQREQIEVIRSMDARVERALMIAIETQRRQNVTERGLRKNFETCPGRFKLEEHFRDHQQEKEREAESDNRIAQKGKMKLTKWQIAAIFTSIAFGAANLIIVFTEKIGAFIQDILKGV